MPRVPLDPREVFELLINAPQGLTRAEIEETLGLSFNSMNYHLKKKCFTKLPSGRYTVTVRDLNSFLTLGQYAIPVAKQSKPELPFAIPDWRKFNSNITLEEFATDENQAAKYFALTLKRMQENPVGEITLKNIALLADILNSYISAACSDPRYPDPETRPYVKDAKLK